MITLAILGGRGMLGADLAELCRENAIDTRVFDLPDFDITDSARLTEAVEAARMIVNCAAYTNVDGAEREPNLAQRVNADAVGRLGELAAAAGKYALHISTDFVFDGTGDAPYCETDVPNPINTYGRTKLAGERLLTASGCEHAIIRVQWTYGAHGKNFVTKMLDLAESGRTPKVVDDQIGSPTATSEVAKVLLRFLDIKPVGLFHYAAAGCASRYDLARFIFETLGIDADLTPCKSTEFKTPARRPLNSRFDCTRISKLLSEPIENWKKPLETFLRRL